MSRIDIDSSDYVGRATSDVEAELRNLQLVPNVVDGDPATGSNQPNTVQSLDPTGSLTAGTTITIRQYTTPPSVEKPATPTASDVSDTGAVTFSWAEATCPTGYTVSTYTWIATGGKDSSGATSGTISSTAVNIQADAADEPVTFKYSVTCGAAATTSPSRPVPMPPRRPGPSATRRTRATAPTRVTARTRARGAGLTPYRGLDTVP